VRRGCARTRKNRATHAAGSIETPRLIWAVNVMELSKSGPKPLFWLSYRRRAGGPMTGRPRLHGSFVGVFQGRSGPEDYGGHFKVKHYMIQRARFDEGQA
jgi:hypothetical protein